VSSDLEHHLTPAEDDPRALVQVVLVWNAADAASPVASQGRSLANLLWQEGGLASRHDKDKRSEGAHSPLLHSVVLNYQAAACNTVLGSSWEHVAGPETVWQRWQGTPVSIGPGSFVQANFGAFQSALAAIADAVPSQAEHVVELHAGVGAIGLSLLGRSSSSIDRPPPNPGPSKEPGPSKPSKPGPSDPGSSKELFPCLKSLRCVEINPNGDPLFKASAARLLANWGKHQLSRNTACSQQLRGNPQTSRDIACSQPLRGIPQQGKGTPQQHKGSPHEVPGECEPCNPELLESHIPSTVQLQHPSSHPSAPSFPPSKHTLSTGESPLNCDEVYQEGKRSRFERPSAASATQAGKSGDQVCGPRCCPVPERVEYVVAAAGSQPDTFLQGADVVIVDPPRKGLELSLLEALRRCDWPRRQHEVACEKATGQRPQTQQQQQPQPASAQQPLHSDTKDTQGDTLSPPIPQQHLRNDALSASSVSTQHHPDSTATNAASASGPKQHHHSAVPSTAPALPQQQPHGTVTNTAPSPPPPPSSEQHSPHTVFSAVPPRRLIYLSCGYPALVRDTQVLLGLHAAPQKGGGTPGVLAKARGSAVQKEEGASTKAGVKMEGRGKEGGGSEGVEGRSMSKSSKRRRRRQRRCVDSAQAQQTKAEVQETVESDGGGEIEGEPVVRWRLVEAKAFSFFPGTDSIETLAVFEEVLNAPDSSQKPCL